MFNLPLRSSTAHEVTHVAFAHAQVRDPTARLDFVSAHLPGLAAIDPRIRVRCMEGYVTDQATPLDKTRDVVVPLRKGHASGVRCGLHPREQIGVITCCDPEHITPIMDLSGLDVWRMGTQTVFGDHHREVWIILTPFGNQAFGGMACTIIVVRAILFHDQCRPQRHHCTHVWMDKRRAQHLLSRCARTVAVNRV